ncbi:L,D-transpeptidase family protein [Sphingomonas sp.]|uniref:L,D-transpeptidase family protein n=1 Tax=Sphingomonas sp. TaxID=28214 RepID=UPI0025ED1F5F|nr:L,D-transpeptidase family protein [Sphingomonas sp.]
MKVQNGLSSILGVLVAGAGGMAQAQYVAPGDPGLSAASSVASYYDRFHARPIWFRNGVADPATAQLVSILRRASFDGLPSGPALAARAEAALAQAQSGNPMDIQSADHLLSTDWVEYVQTIKQPTKGMSYAYRVLAPQGTRADQILLTAAAAPSLAAYVTATSNVNPIYSSLRDTAWAQAQATGNFTPDPRLLANLDRVRSIPAAGRFIVVDSGSQLLTMYENGHPVDSMKVVSGKPELPTPLIASIMSYIVYNPYWNVPDHLVRKVTAPNVLKEGDAYLKRQGYKVMADWTVDSAVVPWTQIDWKGVLAGNVHIRVRQDPGPKNSMGRLKFPFPNGEDIYLHDSPEREYFDKNARSLSNGCVRLQDARRLGRWLLGQEPAAPSQDAEVQVQLPRGVPVYVTYITAQVQNGQIAYLPDVYGWDSAPPQQIASAR